MSADYSKACDHDNIEKRPFARTWVCIDCGAEIPEMRDPMRVDAAAMGVGTPGSFTEALGPIKLDYATAVNDSRVLNWRRIPHAGALPMPLDKPFYTAWRIVPWGSPVGEVHWRVERVEPGKPCPALAQWWADDLLGLPPCND